MKTPLKIKNIPKELFNLITKQAQLLYQVQLIFTLTPFCKNLLDHIYQVVNKINQFGN